MDRIGYYKNYIDIKIKELPVQVQNIQFIYSMKNENFKKEKDEISNKMIRSVILESSPKKINQVEINNMVLPKCPITCSDGQCGVTYYKIGFENKSRKMNPIELPYIDILQVMAEQKNQSKFNNESNSDKIEVSNMRDSIAFSVGKNSSTKNSVLTSIQIDGLISKFGLKKVKGNKDDKAKALLEAIDRYQKDIQITMSTEVSQPIFDYDKMFPELNENENENEYEYEYE